MKNKFTTISDLSQDASTTESRAWNCTYAKARNQKRNQHLDGLLRPEALLENCARGGTLRKCFTTQYFITKTISWKIWMAFPFWYISALVVVSRMTLAP